MKCQQCKAKIDKDEYLCNECWDRPFQITSVCRADLLQTISKKEIATIDDGDMERIASKMADAYCDNGFWIDLPIITEHVTEIKC